MSHLIVATLNLGQYEGMDPSTQENAQRAARGLFGYIDENGGQHPPVEEVHFDRLKSLQRTATTVGWMAIVNDENHAKLKAFLENQKAFSGLFSLTETPLNDNETTQQVYCNTSPVSAQDCWGSRGIGGGGT